MVHGSQKDRIKKSGKQKMKVMKCIHCEYGDPDPKSQFNVPKGVKDDKKVRPKEVFEGYKDPVKSKRRSVSSNGKKGPSNRKVY